MAAGTTLKSGFSASSGRSNMDTIGARDVGKGARTPLPAQHVAGACDKRGKPVDVVILRFGLCKEACPSSMAKEVYLT